MTENFLAYLKMPSSRLALSSDVSY